MDTKKLRQKILDLAIRGKLVPQDPNDEPASVLLERIHAEKERLIKEGKNKRSKNTTTGDEIEVPFEIPESWEWCNITEITSKITDGTHNSPPNGPNGAYKYVTAKNIKPSGIILDNISYVDETIHNEIYARCNPEYGDILYIKDGATTGVVTINNLNEPFSLLSSVALIKPYSRISNKYLLYYLQSDTCLNSVRRSMKGVGITRITLKQIEQWNIPLPPYPEQKRIANEVERWFAVIDELESSEGDLLKAIDQAKSKILDLAIHGKLVPQDPNEEPAIDLLKRINPKFEACDEEYCPFIIPASWCWAMLANVCDIITGSTPSKVHPEYYGGDFPFYKPSDLDAGRHVAVPSEYLTEAGRDVSRIIPKNSTAICCIGSIGKSGYIEREGTTNQQINTAIPLEGLYPLYLYYFCNSTFFVDNLSADSSAITIAIVNKSKLGKILISIPPYQEQLRIVSKIEELFTILDNIKESLE